MTSDLDLCRAFVEAHPEDAARVLEQLPTTDVAALLDALPADSAVRVFEQMTATVAADCLSLMQPAGAAAAVAASPTDLAAALLRRLDEVGQAALLEVLPRQEANHLRIVLRHREGTAGALMDPRAMAIADDVTAGEALARIRKSPRHLLYYLYVVDRTRRLVGVIDLRELMLARPGAPLSGIMHRSVARLSAHLTRAAILVHPGWKHFHALPVVDEDSTLLGALRYQMFRRLEDETRDRPRSADAVTAVLALGELYWLGLSGVLDGLAWVVSGRSENQDGSQGANHGAA